MTDPQNMRAAIAAFPDHLEEGWTRGAAADAFGLDGSAIDGVVVCGMGGSAIGGDLVRCLVESTAGVPFVVNRGYGLPAWVGEKTLVIASSYSGGTEETLSALDVARARGARLLAITSGGTLGDAGLDTVTISGGMQPRAALGYSLGVLLRIARTLGLMNVSDDAMSAALRAARDRAATLGADGSNPASDLAAALDGKLPVVYTGVGLMEAAGMRWRTQIHENAKHPAVGNVLPELDHNEIMGFEAGPAELMDRTVVVALRDAEDHPQVSKRFDVTRELVQDGIAGWHEIAFDEASLLDRVLHAVQLGDWVSFWLAARKDVDPTPVETIQALKRTLAA